MSESPPEKQAVRRLLADVIDSFEKLEIVMHVYRAGFKMPVASELAKTISVPLDEVEASLHALAAAQALAPKGPWRSAIDALVRLYDEDRIEVMNLMTRTALERVRKEAARVFADAFVLRPKKKGDPDA